MRFHLIHLDGPGVVAAIHAAAARDIAGGTIYDALLIQCARQARAERIYTFNRKHFERAGSDLLDRISEPA